MITYIEVRLILEVIAVAIFAYMVVTGAGLPFLMLEIRSVLATAVRYLDYISYDYGYREPLLTLVVCFTLAPAVVFLYERMKLKEKLHIATLKLQMAFDEIDNR